MSLRLGSMAGVLVAASAALGAVAPAVPVPPAAPDLSTWVAIAPFVPNSPEMRCANSSTGGEWTVTATGAQAQARPFVYPPDLKFPFALPRGVRFQRPRTRIDVVDGVLVGFDAGEWGGGLWWFARDGSADYEVSDVNTLAIFKTSAGALAFGGLDHLGLAQGRVSELVHQGGRWKVLRSLDLGSAPEVVAADPRGGYLVVTRAGLSRYTAGRIASVHAPQYSLPSPNSLVVMPDGSVRIGMRHAVARLTPKGEGYSEDWLVRPDCRTVTMDEDDPLQRCHCSAKP